MGLYILHPLSEFLYIKTLGRPALCVAIIIRILSGKGGKSGGGVD
jgi:hypothetical protein